MIISFIDIYQFYSTDRDWIQEMDPLVLRDKFFFLFVNILEEFQKPRR